MVQNKWVYAAEGHGHARWGLQMHENGASHAEGDHRARANGSHILVRYLHSLSRLKLDMFNQVIFDL